ncbi:MAG: glycogen debranching enzyme family protein [Bryobacterales bacterium]|nr:glycogen debranching enzyme family protein [Bryobacterales bacterium]
MSWPGKNGRTPEVGLTSEWLVTNGLGGYASGTLSGVITRRYHGYLVAALPVPFGRVMMLNELGERLELPGGKVFHLSGEERAGSPAKLAAMEYLSEFRLEAGVPVWRYEVGQITFEKRLVLPHGQNTAFINYRLVSGEDGARLILRPSIHFRPHETAVSAELESTYTLTVGQDRYEVSSGTDLPPLRLLLDGQNAALTVDRIRIEQVTYQIEERRGYPAHGDLWSPGFFHVDLRKDCDATLIVSSESWEDMHALTPLMSLQSESERKRRILLAAANTLGQDAQDLLEKHPTTAELVWAADQFLITPAGRTDDATRARAVGDEVRTVIAGYHWFTDWGRDTMISLEGLTLSTGRYAEAAWILRTFAHYVRDGLIPNLFPERKTEGLYHTADATLWFFHALDRYTTVSGDRSVLCMALPKLLDIFEWHMRGTAFGIGVDKRDGLLAQGAEGYALTWMDAKVDDWVVTPRRGKAVEINALWYNALKLLEGWLTEENDPEKAARVRDCARENRESFNARFWYEPGKHLYDVLDGPEGDDPACRPNQLLAISLKHPVLNEEHWPAVVEAARAKLLTPVGLRSLSPDHPDYKPKYDGDLRARDAAYHQGTVWAWLIGPFVDAWLKVHPGDLEGAGKFLEGFKPHLRDACIGSISEIFDAEPPFTPRGCIAQAWSVAEVLRCWIKCRMHQKTVSSQKSPASATENSPSSETRS